MADLGTLVILAAFVAAVYGAVTAIVGHRTRSISMRTSSLRAVVATAILISIAVAALIIAFVTRDFSLRYVAERSSRAMDLPLTVAAFYSGQAGSLLYWTWTLSILSAIVVFQNRRQLTDLMPYVQAVLLGIQVFLLFMLGFISSPFERLSFVPADGLGLNPLLDDYGMLIHPPMLLAGYMSWAVPFAFVIAALIYNVALGVINRAMPQLMVAMIGAPALTAGGLILLMLAAPAILSAWVRHLGGVLQMPF